MNRWLNGWQHEDSQGQTLTKSLKLREQPTTKQQGSSEFGKRRSNQTRPNQLVKHAKTPSQNKPNGLEHRNFEPVPRA